MLAKTSKSFDLLLTSPPYFNKEKYSDAETQSCVRYKENNEWLSKYLFETLRRSLKYIKPGGFFAINIADIRCKNIARIVQICRPMLVFLTKQLRLDYLGCLAYPLSDKKEPFWLLRVNLNNHFVLNITPSLASSSSWSGESSTSKQIDEEEEIIEVISEGYAPLIVVQDSKKRKRDDTPISSPQSVSLDIQSVSRDSEFVKEDGDINGREEGTMLKKSRVKGSNVSSDIEEEEEELFEVVEVISEGFAPIRE